MFNFLKCKFGLHKLVPLDLGDMNYKDEIHGWIEQDVCVFCGYKTRIREYYQKRWNDETIIKVYWIYTDIIFGCP